MPREDNVLTGNEARWTEQQLRRATLRDIIERNYGVDLTRKEIVELLEQTGHGATYDTVARDMREIGAEQVEVSLMGRRVKFWAIVGHAPEYSPEYIREGVDRDIIETEAYKAIVKSTINIFVDDRDVIIITTYEQARPLALWLKNLDWPEIWYFRKEDGSSVIVRCRTAEQASFLSKRLMGFGTDALLDKTYSDRHTPKKDRP